MNNYSKIGQIYKRTLKDINTNGIEIAPRGKKTKELLNYHLEVKDVLRVIINIIGIKEFNYKYCYSELLWYLSGDKSSEFIGKFAKLRIHISQNGEVNSNYGHLLFQKKLESGLTQYERALKRLSEDKNSRQAIIRYNSNEHQTEGVRDFPCTINQQFFIRDNKLIGLTNMRSNDIFYGFPYDIVWFSLVLQSLYIDLLKIYPDLELGQLYHNAGSIHYYEEFYEKVDKILNKSVIKTQKLKLSKSLLELKQLDINKLMKQALRNKHKGQSFFKRKLLKLVG